MLQGQLGEFLAKYVLAPLIIELASWFLNRREIDPSFKAQSDALFASLTKAETKEERRAFAKKLQELIHQK